MILARRALLRTVAVARAVPMLRSANDVQRASKKAHLVAAAPGAHRASGVRRRTDVGPRTPPRAGYYATQPSCSLPTAKTCPVFAHSAAGTERETAPCIPGARLSLGALERKSQKFGPRFRDSRNTLQTFANILFNHLQNGPTIDPQRATTTAQRRQINQFSPGRKYILSALPSSILRRSEIPCPRESAGSASSSS